MPRIIRTLAKNILIAAVVAACFLPISLLAGNYTIDFYEFGKIVVNGKTYDSDIVILPNGSIQPGPDDMHYVLLPELEKVINTPGIETLVIGTGAEGNGLLRKKLIRVVKERGIKLKMMLTQDAMKLINASPKQGLAAMLHLNC